MKIGSIPENLKIFARPESKFKFKWDDIQNDEDPLNLTIKCQPAFITDATNLKSQTVATKWCGHTIYNYETRQREKPSGMEVIDCKNDFIKSVRIIGLEVRSQGGRAWKCLINNKYLVDMREDVLLDTMINSGIGPGANLPGNYIFAMISSEMKLIRVGSLLHKKMIESTEFNLKSKITKLDVGGIYQNKVGIFLYLGQVYSRTVKSEDIDSSYYQRFSYTRKYKYTLQKPSKHHCVVQLKSVIQNMSELENISRSNISFPAKLSTSYRDKIGQIDVTNMQENLNILLQKANVEELVNRSPAYIPSFAFYLNITLTPGYIHPLIATIPNLIIL